VSASAPLPLPPRSVRDLAGLVADARYDPATRAIRGRLALAASAAWLRDLIPRFPPRVLGLSADLWVTRKGNAVSSIVSVNSVDIVVSPAAGGRFEQAQLGRKESPMNEQTNVERVQAGASTPGWSPALPGTPLSGTPGSSLAAPDSDEAQDLNRALAIERLELRLERARLPEALKDHCRGTVALGILPPAAAEEMIVRLQNAWADAHAQASITGLGQPLRVRDGLERLELALGRLLGQPVAAGDGDIPRLSGLRELYDTLTGDWERHGLFRPERVTLANVTTSTMAQVTANALNKAVLAAYERRPQWWRPIVHEEDFASLHDVRWITLGGFSDLDTVAEGNAYTEKTWDDYAETASFVKKGNYVGVTLEMIDRDDVGALRAIPREIALAANRTLAAAISAIFTANSGLGPTLADTEKLFDAAAHGNLGTTALSANAWDAVVQAMFQQPEFHSGKALGVRPRYCLVPIELEKTALGIFTSEFEYGAEGFDVNVRQGDPRHVIAVPEWTDADNWAAVADPADLEGLCVGYRFGRAPEVFVADNALSGAMFTHDELRIKVRFVYAVGVGDYRALYKANVSA
jgi:hypothetical protein